MKINQKKKICKTCGKSRYIFSKGDCNGCARIRYNKKMMLGSNPNSKKTDKVPRKKRRTSYKNKSAEKLLPTLVRWCHKYIRQRDADLPCISCGKYRKHQAGHFQSGGKFLNIKFDTDNIHGQCKQCNYYGGMEIGANYRRNLIDRIGIERVEIVEEKAAWWKRNRKGWDWDREWIIEQIEMFKKLVI